MFNKEIKTMETVQHEYILCRPIGANIIPSELEKPKKYHKEYHTIKDRRQQKT